MAFVSLFSSPPNPVLDKNMTDSVLAGDEREDGELEDGEIDDEGIGIEDEVKEVKEEPEEKDRDKKERDKDHKTHRHSRKRHWKDKRRPKRRRRDRQKHQSPSSGSSSESYDSDQEHKERPKSKKKSGSYRDFDGQFAQHEHDAGGGHGKPQRSAQRKNSEMDKFSDYSEEKYEYEGEDDDFTEELSKYKQAKECGGPGQGKGGQMKDQPKRPNMKNQQKMQQYGGQRGRGRGAAGRGRGLPNKNKKQKGKSWARGRGRGGEQGGSDGMKMDGKGPPGFPKKRPIMSQEFISQHSVEHNGRHICKYFLEGRCIKGDQCKFEHDKDVPDAKKKGLCKFYVQGYCSKGENCIYMHNEYPCKFFHTGAKCYQGDCCKFSHDPLNDVTKELLFKILNTDEENAGDAQEVEELRKQGIAPLPKPPPGVGLLPTPEPGSPQEGAKKIPSLFEIKVQPTVDLAQKIAIRPNFYNSSCPQGGQFQGNGGPAQFSGGPEEMQGGNMMPPGPSATLPPPPGSPGSMGAPPIPYPGPGMPQSPPCQPPPQVFGPSHPMPPSLPPGFHGNRQNPNPQMNQQGAPFSSMQGLEMPLNVPFQGMPSSFFKSLFSSQALGLGEEGQSSVPAQDPPPQQGPPESHGSMQGFLPAMQKAWFLHLNQNQNPNQNQQDVTGPQGPEGQGDDSANRDKDDTTNWYSSDDEDGSSVTAILKSLKKQNEMMKTPQAQPKPPHPGSGLAAAGPSDPRLQKDRTGPGDPRVKADPRQRQPDPRKEADSVADPRLTRDPRKPKPSEPNLPKGDPHRHHPRQKPPVGEEDDDGERELRERAALIPLDPSPAAVLRDPRCQFKQFSHIRVDILLQRPGFAQTVMWAPEDLIPLPLPKQEPSINLPLPPLIADAQLHRSLSTPPDHPAAAASDPHPNPARLRGAVGRLGSPPSRTLEPRPAPEKLMDPRTHKALDPRISRSASLDSKPPALRAAPTSSRAADPRLQRAGGGGSGQGAGGGPGQGTGPVKPDSDKLPPYVPRQSSSGAGLESPTTLLGGISLYDPRNHKLLSPKREGAEPAKKERGSTPPPPQLSPPHPRQGAPEDGKDGQTGSGSVAGAVPAVAFVPPSSPVRVAAPAVHNLPIAALAGLIRPPYADPRQAKPNGQGGTALPEKEEKEKEKEEEEEEEGGEEEEEEKKEESKDDISLRDVFKTFDPTASPFCQ